MSEDIGRDDPEKPASKPAGVFQRIFLPAIILQSILIGGGYSTGREVVEYAGKYGPAGWLSMLIIFVGFTVISVLSFELARVFRVYDYKKWIRLLIGRLWPLFDFLMIVMVLLVIAVMASAMGNIMRQTLNLPTFLSGAIVFLVVAVLAYYGETVIERFKTVGTGFLYLGYLIFGSLVLAHSWDAIEATFANTGFGFGESGPGPVTRAGILYVGYNISVYPAVIFALHRQKDRRDTVLAGLVAGVMMTLPFALTFVCLMGYYPDDAVLGANVPWLRMLDEVGGGWVVAVYGIVVAWTLIETSVGNIHAIIDRLHKNMEDLRFIRASRGAGLTRRTRALMTLGILLISMLLSKIGIIALVATGYSIMAYAYLILLAFPILTIGAYRIWTRK